MKGKWSRLWASVVAIATVLSLSAAPVLATNGEAAANAANSSTFQFEGTTGLIQQVAKDLKADGQVYEEKEEDESLAAKVEEKSGMTLGAVKTELGFALFDNYEAGVIETEKYGLNETEMTDVMTETLYDNHLTDVVTYDLKTEDGVVTAVNYKMRESFTSGLDEIDEISPEAEAQEPISVQAALTAEPNAARPSEDHVHKYTAEFHWEWMYVNNQDGEDEGEDPDYGLLFDEETGDITASQQTTIAWYVSSVDITCSDCEDKHTIYPTENPEESPIQVSALYVDAEKFGTEIDPAKYGQYVNCVVYEATCTAAGLGEDGEDLTFNSEILNASERQLQMHYATMCSFTRTYANHFGISSPYWTSKNTDMSPIGAVKSMCNMYPDDFVPAGNLDYMVDMLSQAFMAYEQKLGSLLDIRINDCMNRLDDSMTDVQKLLVIHDWLANNASFDMAAITAMKSGESAGSDPSQMTAFGTLMPELLEFDGCICLGYAATYALLVQHAFPEIYRNKKDDGSWGSWKTPEEVGDKAMVDFVQCRFYADIAETSVAGPNSGFGEAGTMFNETHYYNAVKIGGNWYYVDACYDDVYCEVMSQYRVETDGNISHNYFMFSPVSALDMFDGYIDYIDSAYDGVVFERTPVLDENGNPTYENGSPVYEKDEDGHVIWTKKDTENETAYDDGTYEETWFTGAVGEISFDDEYWYYTAGEINSYASMSDMMDGMNNVNMDDYDFDMSDMMSNDGPEYADKVVRRPRKAADEPDDSCKKEVEYSFDMNGQQQTGTREVYDDAYDEVLFHYGYGTLGEPTEAEKTDGGKYKDLVDLDASYNDLYPDLAHTTGVYNEVIYFNVANKIYSLALSDLADGTWDITQIKEYNEVHANTDGRDFTGMSFYVAEDDTADNYAFTVVNHPIAAVSIEDRVVYGADGAPSLVPKMTVSIGTNYSESYAIDGEQEADAEGNPKVDESGNPVYEQVNYKEEAVHYNPDYINAKYSKDDPNSNVEFMWCANVVEQMDMGTLLDNIGSDKTVEVTVAPWCGQDGFTEARTETYGLSDGTNKTVEENTALEHHYVYHEREEWHICDLCKAPYDQEAPGHIITGETKFIWSEDYSSCDLQFTCGVETCEANTVPCEVTEEIIDQPTETKTGSKKCTASYTDGNRTYKEEQTVEMPKLEHAYGEPKFTWSDDYSSCEALFVCPNADCKESERKIKCTIKKDTITEPTEFEVGSAKYTASCELEGKTYTDEKTVELETVGHVYSEPEFTWTENYSVCTAVFTCTNNNGCTAVKTIDCKVTSKVIKEATEETGGTKEYTATCEFEGKTYTDTQTVVNPFIDVADTDWYYGTVMYNYTNGIMKGTSENTFEPDIALNRAMVAQILYNLEGKPKVESYDHFTDVAADAWYADAVNWAAETKLVLGYEDDTFRASNSAVREQMATILYRYAEYKGYDMKGSSDLSEFTDVSEIHDWALEAMRWAVHYEIFKGRGEGILAPRELAKRSEVAQLFMNFQENYAK
ncbi:MAG: S-layer homology domain-containing protein [Oscillospiraceae bacterium]|jgi:hypothetical protein